ncbi:ribosome recycling factor [Candidatus Sumerlaeota bacterium]|nr:ribosome recycling factor [Candidatus Sumerlaeota bacterium]
MLEALYKETKEKMDGAMTTLDRDFNSLRTGRATTTVLDTVHVEAYGTEQPVKAIATITTPDAHTILVQPWDKNVLGAIERAILAANIGLTPNNDGKVIRLNIPPLTEETRKELVKQAHHMAEEQRVAVRNVRRHSNDHVKKLNKDKNISDDEMSVALDKIQEMTDNHIKKVDAKLADKEAELLKV